MSVSWVNALRAAPTLERGPLKNEACPNPEQISHKTSHMINAGDYAMDEVRVNAFDALISPPSGFVAVSDYLAAVSRALKVRSDSELSRMMGVAASTLGSWKLRGGVPDEHSSWLKKNLVSKIIARNDDLPFASSTARAAVIELIARTAGNPLQVERFRLSVSASMLAPLLATAELLVQLSGIESSRLDSSTVEQIADLLEGAGPAFRSSLNPEIL